MEHYTNVRELIKDLAINTGTSQAPAYTNLCTTTEITFTTDFEQQDWYTFCDAIQRSLITGVAVSLETTVKLDANNESQKTILGMIHSVLKDGSVAQFNNQSVKFSLLTGANDGVLEYTTYTVPAVLNFSDLGGASEDVTEYSLTIVITGKATES